MSIPCIPTLDPTAKIITNDQDIVAYIIRHIIAQPAGFTDVYTNTVVSFREIEANYGSNKATLCSILESRIQDVLQRYIPAARVSVTHTQPDNETSNYNIEIRVKTPDKDGNYNLILTDAKISIKPGNIFNIVFTGAKI